jgi:hypothetical protein
MWGLLTLFRKIIPSVPLDLFKSRAKSLKQTGQGLSIKETGLSKTLKQTGCAKWVQ